MSVVFVDTETTGLDPTRHEVYEIALIDKREEAVFWLEPDLRRADPNALRITDYYRRAAGPAGLPAAVRSDDESGWTETPSGIVALAVAVMTAGKHLVGAVPSFDAAFLTNFLVDHGYQPAWHYHLIDVEALAAGYLMGTFSAIQEVGKNPDADGPTVEEAKQAIPPWDSEALSRALGINPEDFDRHTALGDARWAKAMYEAVMS